MGKPAARLGDSTGHGGVIVAGSPNVLIGNMPAARVNDMHVCPMLNPGTPPPPHVGGVISIGSPTVMINGMMAARVGDMAICQGPPDSIAMGCFTVLIGESSSGGGGAGSPGGGSSGQTGAEAPEAEAGSADSSGGSPLGPAIASAISAAEGQDLATGEDHFLDVKFVDQAGNPVKSPSYKLTSPAQKVAKGVLKGHAKKTGIQPGSYQVDVRSITKIAWSKDTARQGDQISLLAECVGIQEGAPAQLDVYCRDIMRPDKMIASFPDLKVTGGKVRANWNYSHPEDMKQNDPEKTSQYSSPQFYFKVDIDGEKRRSGMLAYQDWVDLEIKDEDDNPAKNIGYTLVLANGEIRRGKLDGLGKAKEKNLPPGSIKLRLDESS